MTGWILAKPAEDLAFLNGYPLVHGASVLNDDIGEFSATYMIAGDPDPVRRRLAVDAPGAGLKAQSPHRFVSLDGRLRVTEFGGMLLISRPTRLRDRLEWWIYRNRRALLPRLRYR